MEEELCGWNFCKTCIDTRIRKKLPMPELKSKEGYEQYFRYIFPRMRPTAYLSKKKKALLTNSPMAE